MTVVTSVTAAGKPAGLTVNSFTSVSLDPPLVLWNLSRHSANWQAFQDIEYFAINVLTAEQAELALEFARAEATPFADLDYERGAGGVPLLRGSLAQFECRLAERRNSGDHETLVGEVMNYREFAGEPLLFHRGRFGRFVAT